MSRLDAYIESAMSRMGLEEPQRAEIEKELRAPLERAVEAGIAKGLTREQAEDQVIRAANQSSFLFKHFGIPPDQAWAYSEYIAVLLLFSINILWLCYIIIKPVEDVRSYAFLSPPQGFFFLSLFISIAVWIFLFLQMFKRVEIRAGLEVRRFLRSPRRILFDRITRIRFGIIPFLRPRRIVIKTVDRPVVLDRMFNGLSVAAAALNAFAPDKIDKEVQQYLKKIKRRVKVRPESASVRVILTFLMCFILLGFFVFVRPLWEGFGCGLPLVVVLFAAIILILFQLRFHNDKAKRGLSILLFIIAFIASNRIVGSPIFGDISQARWLSTWIPPALIGAVLLLWWRWSRVFMVGLFAFCAVLVYSSCYFLPSLYSKELKPLVFKATPYPLFDMQILGSEGPVVWIDSYKQNDSENRIQEFKIAYLNGDIRSMKIEKPGWWDLISPTPFQEPCLLGTISHETTSTYEVHIYNQDVSEVKKVIPLPPETNLYGLDSPMYPVWSPDGKYLITRTVEHNETYEYKMQAVNIQNGSTTEFQSIWSPFRWVDNRTIEGRLTSKDKTDDEAASKRPKSIDIWHIDVEKGSRELILQRELSEKEKYKAVFPGLKYAFITYYETPLSPDALSEQPPDSCYIMNIETSDTLSVPLPKEWKHLYFLVSMGWSEENSTLAYIANPENQDEGERIIVVDLKSRSITARKFPPNVHIENIALSPDGKKILFIRSLENDPLLKLFSRLDLWDLEKDEIVPVRSLGIFEVFLQSRSYPVWSPDSTWFAYPFIQERIRGVCHTVEVVKVP